MINRKVNHLRRVCNKNILLVLVLRVRFTKGISKKGCETMDNGGMRSGMDRRQSANADHKPERRSGRDRRSGVDRRNDQIDRGSQAIERRDLFRKTNNTNR